MPKLKYLYYFSSPDIEVIEVKRLDLGDAPLSEIYKWLVVSRPTGKVRQLTFRSMNKIDDREFRTFIEGALEFDGKRAVLSVLSGEHVMEVLATEVISPATSRLVEEFLGSLPVQE